MELPNKKTLEARVAELDEELKGTCMITDLEVIDWQDEQKLPDTPACKVKSVRSLLWEDYKLADLAWHPDSEKVLVVSKDGKIKIHNFLVDTPDYLLENETFYMSCTYDLTGSLVVVGGLDNVVTMFAPDEDNFAELAINADGSVDHGTKPKLVLKGHRGYISDIKFLSKAECLTSSGDNNVILWDINKNAIKHTFKGHSEDVNCLDVVAEEPNIFVTGAADQCCRLWDKRMDDNVNTKARFQVSNPVNDIKFLNMHTFGCALENGDAWLFDLRTMQPLQCYKDSLGDIDAKQLDFSKSGKYLFTGNDRFEITCFDVIETVWLWSEPMKQNLAAASPIAGLEVSPDGNAIAVCSRDSLIQVFACSQGKA